VTAATLEAAAAQSAAPARACVFRGARAVASAAGTATGTATTVTDILTVTAPA